MNLLEKLSPIEVGNRLRTVRETAGITQASAAESIGAARTTLIAIEQGRRHVRFDELRALCALYGSSVNAVLRQEAIHADLQPRFRKLQNSNDSAVEAASTMLSTLVQAETELENLLGVLRHHNPIPERPILSGDVCIQAEQDAAEVRRWLGIGQGSIPDLVSILELGLGARIYSRRLDGRISGLFAYDDALGPCFLLNANHPKARRNQSIAHELGHYISSRSEPVVTGWNGEENSREERYANCFARAFLTPCRAMMEKFTAVIAGSTSITRRHVIILAHYFNVSREALVRRLEELKLIRSGSWDWFVANGGITDDQARQVLGDLDDTDEGKVDAARPISLRLSMLAAEAAKRCLLSEGQLCHLLKVDRFELRNILLESEIEGKGENDGCALPQR